MDFTIDTKIKVGEAERKIFVKATHYPTKNDLNEFAVDQGFNDYEDYFKTFVSDDDDMRDIIETVEKNPTDCHGVECYISVDCRDEKPFKSFLAQKYREKVLEAFLESLNVSSTSLEV